MEIITNLNKQIKCSDCYLADFPSICCTVRCPVKIQNEFLKTLKRKEVRRIDDRLFTNQTKLEKLTARLTDELQLTLLEEGED